MEDLILQYFDTMEDKSQLRLLSVRGIAQAVSNFIEKDDRDAVGLIVEKQLQQSLEQLKTRQGDNDPDVIDEELDEYRRLRAERRVDEVAEAREVLGSSSKAPRQAANDSFESEEEGFGDDGLFGSTTSGGKKNKNSSSKVPPRGRGRPRGAPSRNKRPVAEVVRDSDDDDTGDGRARQQAASTTVSRGSRRVSRGRGAGGVQGNIINAFTRQSQKAAETAASKKIATRKSSRVSPYAGAYIDESTDDSD